MPGRRKVDGKTASIIGTVVTLVPQSMSECIEAKHQSYKRSWSAYLTAGGVNVNEASATSSSDELSNPATVIVH